MDDEFHEVAANAMQTWRVGIPPSRGHLSLESEDGNLDGVSVTSCKSANEDTLIGGAVPARGFAQLVPANRPATVSVRNNANTLKRVRALFRPAM